MRHLHDDKRLSKKTVNMVLRLVRMGCDQAISDGVITSNVAKGITGMHQANPLRPRPRRKPRPLTPLEVKSFAAQFDPWLRIAILLMYVGCLRLSEVFGLELRDWDPATQMLAIRRQGGLKKNEGKRDPRRPDEADGQLKTNSSYRTIPLPPVLAEMLDEHIAVFHGSCPADSAPAAEWGTRRLIRTASIEKPRNTVLADRWDQALKRTGLDAETLGFSVNRHYLRRLGSTVIGVGNIRGKLWSAYLGHAIPAEFGGSLVTIQHYFDLPDEELRVIAEYWQRYLVASVGDLQIKDTWWSMPHLTMAEAARELGVHEVQVGWLVGRGRLRYAPDDEVSQWRRQAGIYRCDDRLMISGPSVVEERERRARFHDALTEKDVAAELGVGEHYVRRLRARGDLKAEKVNDQRWSFDRTSVDAVAEARARERQEAALYLSLSDAAALLRISQREVMVSVAPRVRSRVLITDGRVEYLRSDVESLAAGPARPARY